MTKEDPEAAAVAADVAQLSLEKKPKQRKAQTEAEFAAQKAQFLAAGPRTNTADWLYDESVLQLLDNAQKTDRVHILHACEKAYFTRDYAKCLALVAEGERLFGVELDETTNDTIKTEFAHAGRKTRKSSKVERHVVELLHIKEACLRKLEALAALALAGAEAQAGAQEEAEEL